MIFNRRQSRYARYLIRKEEDNWIILRIGPCSHSSLPSLIVHPRRPRRPELYSPPGVTIRSACWRGDSRVTARPFLPSGLTIHVSPLLECPSSFFQRLLFLSLSNTLRDLPTRNKVARSRGQMFLSPDSSRIIN